MKFKYHNTTPNQRFIILFGEPIPDMLDKLDAFRDANLKSYQDDKDRLQEFEFINELSFYKTSGHSDVGQILVVIFGDLMNSDYKLRTEFINHIKKS